MAARLERPSIIWGGFSISLGQLIGKLYGFKIWNNCYLLFWGNLFSSKKKESYLHQVALLNIREVVLHYYLMGRL